MIPEIRTLPIRVVPLPGEALDSWLEALAHRTGTPMRCLLPELGLARLQLRGTAKSPPPNWTICLRPQEMMQIAAVAGVDTETLHAMTLQRWDGQAVVIDHEKRVFLPNTLWARRGSRYCPACLAETGGRWQIAWRLGWSFACVRHRMLLADTCPGCGRTPRSKVPSLVTVPTPSACELPRLGAPARLTTPRCGHPLTDARPLSLAEAPLIVEAQNLIYRILDSNPSGNGTSLLLYPGEQAGPSRILNDARVIASRALRAATDEDLARFAPSDIVAACRAFLDQYSSRRRGPGIHAPRDAAATGLALAAAMDVLAAPDLDAAAERIRWVIERNTTVDHHLTATARAAWGRNISPTLHAVLDKISSQMFPAPPKLSHMTGTGQPRMPAGRARAVQRSRWVPASLWPRWALLLSPARPPRSPVSSIRTMWQSLSACLVCIGSRVGRGDALSLLGNHTANADAVRHLLRRLNAHPQGPQALQLLTQIAERIDQDQPPIDYSRRRSMFAGGPLITPGQWAEVQHPDRPEPEPLAHAHRWLFETLTGSPAETALGPFTLTRDELPSYREFRLRLLPSEVAALRAIASELLIQHDIDEPVRWEPDLPAPLPAMPGPHPDNIDPLLVGQLVLSEDLFPRQIADRLGTTAEHIHHLHDVYPIDWLTPRTRPPSRSQIDQWRTWYVEQEQPLREIASAARVTRSDVTQALRNAGVDIRSGGGRRRYDDETYADVVERYVVEQHSTIRISQDLGIPVTGIVRMLRRQGIASRAPAARLLKHAERLTEVVHRYTIDKQGTTAIAKATGIPSSTVVSMLERAGVALRPRSQRRKPMCS